MTLLRDIRPAFVVASAAVALPLAAIIYFKSRANDQEALAANRTEMTELRAQIALQTQELSALHSIVEQVSQDLVFLKPAMTPASGSSSTPTLPELNRWFSEFALQQSNLLATVYRLAMSETASESPERAGQRAEAAINRLESQYAEQKKTLADAQSEVDTLRINLAVPDDIAVMDLGKAVDDPRLSGYRPYFEAKRKREELRRFSEILRLKLASELIDQVLPR